jgi:hypothetical protein
MMLIIKSSLSVFAYFIHPVMPENSMSSWRILLEIGLKSLNVITPDQVLVLVGL